MTTIRFWSWAGFLVLAGANAAMLARIAQWHGNFGEGEAPLVQIASLMQFVLPFAGYYVFRAVYARSDWRVSKPHVRSLFVVGILILVGLNVAFMVGWRTVDRPPAAADFAWALLCSLLFVPFLSALVVAKAQRPIQMWFVASAMSVIAALLGSLLIAVVIPATAAGQDSSLWVLWLFVCALGFYFASLAAIHLVLWTGALLALCIFILAMWRNLLLGIFYAGGAPVVLFALFACALGVGAYVSERRSTSVIVGNR